MKRPFERPVHLHTFCLKPSLTKCGLINFLEDIRGPMMSFRLVPPELCLAGCGAVTLTRVGLVVSDISDLSCRRDRIWLLFLKLGHVVGRYMLMLMIRHFSARPASLAELPVTDLLRLDTLGHRGDAMRLLQISLVSSEIETPRTARVHSADTASGQ